MPETTNGARPPRRPWHATATLEHVANVTWAVDPDRLATILPDGFEPQIFDTSSTSGASAASCALISAVSFANRSFHFRAAPFVRMSCGQVDHRAYVVHRGERGVWSITSSMDHPLVAVARVGFSMPWHREEIRITAQWSDDRCARMSIAVAGADGAATTVLEGADDGEVPDVLRTPMVTDPAVAWFARQRGGVGRYSVWHRPLDLHPMRVVAARSRPFEAAGVLDTTAAPLGALVAQRSSFDIHTPPRRVAR